jgi:hypothetical protein
MVFWVGSCLGIIFLCGYMANRKPSDPDLDEQILGAQARLDMLLRERALRGGVKVPTQPSFKELRDRNEQMDHGQ